MQRIPGEGVDVSQGPEDRYLENVKFAQEASVYCREIIPVEGSYTHPSITSNLNTLFNEVSAVRKKPLKLAEYLPHLLIGSYEEQLRLMTIKERVKKSKLNRLGNCNELSDLAMNYLRRKNIKRIETLYIVGSDHVFVVIDREGDLNDRKTWGKSCVILDMLNDQIFSPDEINEKLKCYRFDNNRLQQGLNPHLLSDFTDNTKLGVQREFLRRINKSENKEKLENFNKNLDLVLEVSAKYLENKKFEALAQLIKQSKIETSKYESKLDKLTNFTLERLLVKHTKKITKMIESEPNHDAIYDQILMGSLNKEAALEVAITLHLPKVVEGLLNRGADPYEVNGDNYTFFHLAVKNGDLEMVKLILDRDAKENLHNMDREQKDGWIALRMAINYKQPKIVEELLKRGANPHLPQNGISPWHYAVKIGNVDAVNLILDYDSNASRNINSQMSDGWTALHLAVANNDYRMTKDLLFLGANPYIYNQNGFTPWHMAAKNGDLEIIKLILDRDAKENISNINCPKYDGWTALHLAVANNQYGIVEELLKRGADPHLLSQDQYSPYMLAQGSQNHDLINMMNYYIQLSQNQLRQRFT